MTRKTPTYVNNYNETMNAWNKPENEETKKAKQDYYKSQQDFSAKASELAQQMDSGNKVDLTTLKPLKEEADKKANVYNVARANQGIEKNVKETSKGGKYNDSILFDNKGNFYDHNIDVDKYTKIDNDISAQLDALYSKETQTTEDYQAIKDLVNQKEANSALLKESQEKADYQNARISQADFELAKANGNEDEINEKANVYKHYDDTFLERRAYNVATIIPDMIGSVATVADALVDFGMESKAKGMIENAERFKQIGDFESANKLIEQAKELRDYDSTDPTHFGTQLKNWSNQVKGYIQMGVNNPVEKFIADGIDSTANFYVQFLLFQGIGEVAGGMASVLKPFNSVDALAQAGGVAKGVNAINVASKGTLYSMSLQSASQKYLEDMANGYDQNTSLLNALATGALSYATEQIGMDNFVDVLTGGAGKFAYGQALNYMAKSVGTQAMSEGLEEVVEDIFGPIVDAITMGAPIEYNGGEIFYDFLIGGFSGGLMGIGGSATYVVNTQKQYNALKADMETLASQLNTANELERQKILQEIANGQMALNAFDNRSVIGDAVQFVNEMADANLTEEEVTNILSQSIRPNVDAGLTIGEELNNVANATNTISQSLLNAQNIDMDVTEYTNMTEEQRAKFNDDIEKIQKAFGDRLSIGYTTDLRDSNGQVVNASIKNGRVMVNVGANADTPAVISVLHEVVHSIENTPEWHQLAKTIFENFSSKDLLNEIASRGYEIGKDDFYSEAVSVALTEKLLSEADVENVINHIAKYNTSSAYKMLYKFREATGIFKDNSTIGNVTSLLTDALSNSQYMYMADGTKFDRLQDFNTQSSEAIENVRKYGLAKVSRSIQFIPLTKVYTEVVDGKKVFKVKQPRWARDIGLKLRPFVISLSALSNTQYDAKDASTVNFKSSAHTNDDILNPKNPIDVDIINNLDVLFEDPFAVFEGSKPNTYMLVLKATDSKGFPIVLSVSEPSVNSEGQYQKVNFVDYKGNNQTIAGNLASGVYGKNSVKNIAIFLNRLNFLWGDGGMKKSQAINACSTLQWRASGKSLVDSSITQRINKSKQLSIIQKANPMKDGYHTGIRNISDIKTFDEATNVDGDELFTTDDYTIDDINEIKKTKNVTLYSSYPIKNGVFVTPSKMEAQNYAGDGKVYSLTTSVDNVAWIDNLEGQFAKIEVENKKQTSAVEEYSNKVQETENNIDVSKKEIDNWLADKNVVEKVSDILADADNKKIEKIYKTYKTAEELKTKIWDKTASKNINRLKKIFNLPSLNYQETLANDELTSFIIDGGAKSVGSATNKVIRKMFDGNNAVDPNYNLSRIKDANRYTIQVQSAEEVIDTIKKLKENFDTFEFELKVQDRDVYKELYGEEMPKSIPNSGYIGFHGTFVDESGAVVEVQISLDFKGTKVQSDNFYDSIRNKKITPEESDSIYAPSREIWNNYRIRFGLTPLVLRNISDVGIAPASIGGTKGLDNSTQSPLSDTNVSTTNPSLSANKSPSLSMINPSASIDVVPPVNNNIITQDNKIGEAEEKYSRPKTNQNDYYDYGMNPVRRVKIPKQNENGPVSKATRTIANSQYVGKETAREMKKEATNGSGFNYEKTTRKEEVAQARAKIKEIGDIDKAIDYVMKDYDVRTLRISTVMGAELIHELEKRGEGSSKRAEDLRRKVAKTGSLIGQSEEAYKVFKDSDPASQLLTIQDEIRAIQEELNRRWGDRATQISLDEELVKEFDRAKTQEERDAIAEKMAINIAEQIPPTVTERLNGFRHLSMLFNPRTWIKNAVSNMAFGYVNDVRRATQALIEKAVVKDGNKTAGVYNPLNGKEKELNNALKVQYKEKYKGFQGKYSKGDVGSMLGDSKFQKLVEQNRKQFKSKTMNWISDINSKMMSDSPAMSKAYAREIIGELKAKGLPLEITSVTEEMAERAFNKAREITFNAESKLANKIAEIGNTNVATKMVVDSLIPFKRTPINIIKQGVKFSPLQLGKTLTYDLAMLKQGKITGTQFADGLASGLTGTGLVLVGALLRSLGLLRTKDDDKDRKERYDKDNGQQNYAIVWDGGSYTIDWLDPIIMPLSIGAELVDNDNVDGVESLIDVASAVADPIFETSMLSGITKNLEGYDKDVKYVAKLSKNMITNYLGQYVPTIGGAVARTIDDTRRMTYSKEGDIKSFGVSALNKIPFASKLNEPYINRKGEEQKNEDLGIGIAGRGILNFLSPGYYSSNKIDKYDEELYRLYDETGEISAIPSDSTSSFSYDKEQYKLTDKQYTEFQKARWEAEKYFVDSFIDSDMYKTMDDDQRVETIADIRTYAGKLAKSKYFASQGIEYEDSTFDKVQGALDLGIDIQRYYDYENSAGSKQAEKIDYLENSGLSQKEKEYLFGLSGYKKTYQEAYENAMKKNSKSTKKSTTTSSKPH